MKLRKMRRFISHWSALVRCGWREVPSTTLDYVRSRKARPSSPLYYVHSHPIHASTQYTLELFPLCLVLCLPAPIYFSVNVVRFAILHTTRPLRTDFAECIQMSTETSCLLKITGEYRWKTTFFPDFQGNASHAPQCTCDMSNCRSRVRIREDVVCRIIEIRRFLTVNYFIKPKRWTFW